MTSNGIAFDEARRLWIACHRPDAIYVFDLDSKRLEIFAEDWRGEKLRGPTDVAFAGPNRDILLAASLDNLVVHRFDGVGVRGLQLNHPRLPFWKNPRRSTTGECRGRVRLELESFKPCQAERERSG